MQYGALRYGEAYCPKHKQCLWWLWGIFSFDWNGIYLLQAVIDLNLVSVDCCFFAVRKSELFRVSNNLCLVSMNASFYSHHLHVRFQLMDGGSTQTICLNGKIIWQSFKVPLIWLWNFKYVVTRESLDKYQLRMLKGQKSIPISIRSFILGMNIKDTELTSKE